MIKHRLDYVAPLFLIKEVELNFYLEPQETLVTAKILVMRQGEHKKSLILDGEDLILESVLLNDIDTKYIEKDNTLTIQTDLNEFWLTIVTKISPKDNTSLNGLYLFDNTYCSQCEAEGFRKITYFLDRPDVLSKYKVRIDAPIDCPYLLSNGNLLEKGELPNNRHFAVWEDPFLKPSYLFALVAGDFDVLTDEFKTKSDRAIELKFFVEKGYKDKAYHAMESLKKAMRWDEERFNLEYDLDIYMIVAVDFFNMGAMENKGLNVFNTKYVLADPKSATDQDFINIESVIGHEYFHNWTGNRVTCRDWFQLSLKEGLTVFRDQEFSADVSSRAVRRIEQIKVIKEIQFAEDAGPLSHSVRPESVMKVDNFYTTTVYDKGAEVIRMLHTILGEKLFMQGFHNYLQKFDGQAVTCDDFVQSFADVSNRNLTQFKLWYSQAGTPTISVTDSYDLDTKKCSITITQKLKATTTQSSSKPMHIPFALEILALDGVSIHKELLELTRESQTFVFNDIESEDYVLSLLQDFSAPVILKYDYSSSQLITIIKYASSAIARWDAWMQFVHLKLQEAYFCSIEDKDYELPTDIVELTKYILKSEDDLSLQALMLELPTINALIQKIEGEVNLEALIQGHKRFVQKFCTALESNLLDVYSSFTADTIAKRAIRNRCLELLGRLGNKYSHIIRANYYSAKNMTDTLGALTASNQTGSDIRFELMDNFMIENGRDSLIMDNWFKLQSSLNSNNVLELINYSMEHPAFDAKNPNRVRSLIGSFANNIEQFHKLDGSGYDFLASWIKRIDPDNPQLAANLVTAFTKYRRFDKKRQQMMQEHLENLMLIPKLSSNLKEKLLKSLEN